MESKGQPGAAPATSPLLSSHSAYPFLAFRVSRTSRYKITRGRVYIVGFRSRRVCGANDCINWTHEGESGPHHGTRLLNYKVGPISRLVVLPIDFFFSRCSISQKNDVAKILGPFDVSRDLGSQKHVKTKKLLLVLKPNERSCLENTRIQYKTCPDPYKL
jgi:hypothetical protein